MGLKLPILDDFFTHSAELAFIHSFWVNQGACWTIDHRYEPIFRPFWFLEEKMWGLLLESFFIFVFVIFRVITKSRALLNIPWRVFVKEVMEFDLLFLFFYVISDTLRQGQTARLFVGRTFTRPVQTTWSDFLGSTFFRVGMPDNCLESTFFLVMKSWGIFPWSSSVPIL